MFELNHVSRTFGSEAALREVSLTIRGGLNYILGPSGSGKTTLLRILSAMDPGYEGSVQYQGRELKSLTAEERAQLYGAEFGFIAQDFHLIGALSVRENILVPAYLQNEQPEKRLNSLMKKLGIEKLADQKVSTLSGGQKQRVAIARELMKDPKVLIADEPTAALDAKTAGEIGALLAALAKERTVIVVTHDTSLIQGACSVFTLDKGTLCRQELHDAPACQSRPARKLSRLSLRTGLRMAGVTCRRQGGKLVSLAVAMALAVTCLGVSFSGALAAGSREAFEQLLEKQGNSVMNLNIVSSFTGGFQWDSGDETEKSVHQDISGLLEEYQQDSRVEAIILDAPMDDMVVNMNGRDFIIESSHQVPVFNSLVAGKLADNRKHEIVLPQILVEKMGCTNEEILGQELSFLATVYNWDSGEPVAMPVSFQAVVSGVADTSYALEFEGQIQKFAHEDSLFPSLAIMQDVYAQAGRKDASVNFTIRPDSPEHYLELYDELMSRGVVPLGQVALIRDVAALKGTTLVQSGLSNVVIAVLAGLAALAVCLLWGVMRRKEYAIYRLCGYTSGDLARLTLAEYAGLWLIAGALGAAAAALLGLSVWASLGLSVAVAAVCAGLSIGLAVRVEPMAALKTGGRE